VVVLVQLLAFAVRVLGLLLLARFLLGAIRGRAPRPTAPPAAPPTPHSSPDLVRDRVCNTFLPRDRAVLAIVRGQEQHFCSTACRDRALADAARAS